MKKRDIHNLRKLLAVKQQAESLKYKQRKMEQQGLLDEAARCLKDSHQLQLEKTADLSAGDLIAANRFRISLRNRSAILTTAAHSLDEMVDDLRVKTCEAINRESAIDKLAKESEKQDRLEKNGQDEAAREQSIFLQR